MEMVINTLSTTSIAQTPWCAWLTCSLRRLRGLRMRQCSHQRHHDQPCENRPETKSRLHLLVDKYLDNFGCQDHCPTTFQTAQAAYTGDNFPVLPGCRSRWQTARLHLEYLKPDWMTFVPFLVWLGAVLCSIKPSERDCRTATRGFSPSSRLWSAGVCRQFGASHRAWDRSSWDGFWQAASSLVGAQDQTIKSLIKTLQVRLAADRFAALGSPFHWSQPNRFRTAVVAEGARLLHPAFRTS